MAPAGLIGMLMASSGAAAAGMASSADLDEIPTHIVLPTPSTLYPDPICLGCKVVTKVVASNAAAEADAILTLTYDDHEWTTFDGDLVLTVFLPSNKRARLTIDEVLLAPGQSIEWTVRPGLGWSWEDVESVWVELEPAL